MIVAVEGRQGVGVIADHPKHVLAGLGDQFLRGQGAGEQIDGLLHRTQLGGLFAQALLVDGVAFDEMVAQHPRRPLAELGAAPGFDPVAYGDDDVEVIVGGIVEFAVRGSYSEIPNNWSLLQFTFLENILEVFIDGRDGFREQFRHLFLRQPDRLMVEMDLQPGLPVISLIQRYFTAAIFIGCHCPLHAECSLRQRHSAHHAFPPPASPSPAASTPESPHSTDC